MDKKKRLVSLISSEGKTVEEITKEVWEAYEKFKKALAKSEEEIKKKGCENEK